MSGKHKDLYIWAREKNRSERVAALSGDDLVPLMLNPRPFSLDRVLESDEPEGIRRELLERNSAGRSPLLRAELYARIEDFQSGYAISTGDRPPDDRTVPPFPKEALSGSPVDILALPKALFDVEKRTFIGKVSLSGVQDKFLLVAELGEDGGLKLRLPEAEESGNIIIKPCNPEIPFLCECEHASMRLLDEILFEMDGNRTVPRTWLFEDPLLPLRRDILNMDYAVERFNVSPDGRRLKMFDFAAVMELGTAEKYDPSVEDLFGAAEEVLDDADLGRFAEGYFYGYLIGNGDMHIKNFSILQKPDGGYELSPFYDMLSTRAALGDVTMALSLGGTTTPSSSATLRFFSRWTEPDRLLRIAELALDLSEPFAEAAVFGTQKSGWRAHKFCKRFGDQLRRTAGALLERTHRWSGGREDELMSPEPNL